MSQKSRTIVAALSLSAAAFVGILQREDYREQAYPDPTYGWKVPTAGFGTTEGIKQGDSLKVVPAIQRALSDASKFEGALKRCVSVPLHQAEYDLYVNLSYNIGSTGFCGSTIVRRLNSLDYAGACDAILMWNKSNGQDCSAPGNRSCSGLWKDRLKTHAACMAAQ
ncbi:lysozyme [Polaromonas naphthalenivorans]|uniref:Lysozyme n=1 Tax=Polaromonas naphthalenivorans (strain CJ2) TaxID=365044 RepID=A1VPG9_POLNA|nr:lysozyme [Polaromonas naphthalenivorans]ABM37547.1 glycoside hydrolase, family 24 [Polaromonas naphthalenivorans CJ2]